jgi:Fur family transcriptional regulator, ferric uptake regulator
LAGAAGYEVEPLLRSGPSVIVNPVSKQTNDLALRDRLRAVGLRVTSGRVAVARGMIQARTPLSHAEVCELVAQARMDRATVYRTLVDLTDAGIVRRTDLGDHVWRFEWVGDEQPAHTAEAHPHFVCSDCGAVACLPADAVSVRAVRGAPRALRRQAVEVHVRGLCDACV